MNNYPNYPYGYNPQQYQEQYQKEQINRQEKRALRKRSSLVALGAILFVVLSFAVSFIFFLSKKAKYLYTADTAFSLSLYAIITMVSLFGAYLIVRALIDKKHEAYIPLGLPENKKHALLLIPVGVLSCIAGAFGTAAVNSLLEDAFNVTFTQPEIPDPKTPVELMFYLIVSVLIPCIFEEIALRAGALQAMRKYGDWFAIITSSFVFAILHGNMIQTPFAFIAGIALGYIYVVTGSIWPGVVVHFINNFATCSMLFNSVFKISTTTLDYIYGAYLFVFIIAGIVCFFIYLLDKDRPKLNKDTTSLRFSQKVSAFVINVPMIISIIYMGLETLSYIAKDTK